MTEKDEKVLKKDNGNGIVEDALTKDHRMKERVSLQFAELKQD